MVSVCLASDLLSQHLLSYLGFSYLGHGVSRHGCSSKVQPLLLTLDEGYILTAAPPDLEHGVVPLGPPVPWQQPLLWAAAPGLRRGVAPLDHASVRCLQPARFFHVVRRSPKLKQNEVLLSRKGNGESSLALRWGNNLSKS